MAKPVASYNPLFPNAKDPRNTQQERTTADNQLISRAADYNRHNEILRAIECYLGIHPVSWAEGDDTVNTRLVRISGTASCWEGGTICDYSGPEGLDPLGTGYILTTGTLLGNQWVGPNSVFGGPGIPSTAGLPGIPPISPQGPMPGGVPWPAPGGGNFRFKPPVWPIPPLGLPGPLAPVPTLPQQWFVQFGLQYWDFLRQAALFRQNTQSSEDILIQPMQWADVLALFKELAGYIDGWPTTRTNPQDHESPRGAIFDVLFPTAGITRQLTHALGIEWYAGTISSDGADIGFDTGTDLLNTGRDNTDVTKNFLVISNLDDTTLRNTNVDEIETDPGGVAKSGEGLQPAGAYRLSLASAVPAANRPAGANPASVMVGAFTARPQMSTMGDNTTWVVENLAGGSPFTPSYVAADSDVNSDPVQTVIVIAGGIPTGTPLQFNSGALGTGDWQFSGSDIVTFGGDVITEIQIMGLAPATLTS